MKLFLVNGQGGVGKDAFVDLVMAKARARGLNFYKYSAVQGVENIAQQFGWRGEKTNKARKFLYDLKKASSDYCDFSFSDVTQLIDAYCDADAIFILCRDLQEIDRYKQTYSDVRTVLVTRGERLIYGNPADDNAYDYDYDVVIENDEGFDKLHETASVFFEVEMMM